LLDATWSLWREKVDISERDMKREGRPTLDEDGGKFVVGGARYDNLTSIQIESCRGEGRGSGGRPSVVKTILGATPRPVTGKS
jgi:hypothetical protein